MSSTLPPTASPTSATTVVRPSTTNPLTTIFTAPASCTSRWVGFTRGELAGAKYTYLQRLVEDDLVNVMSCYPTSTIPSDEFYRDYRPLIYSPGICPEGWETARSSYVAGEMRATCCASGYSYNSVNANRYLVYSSSRYCTSSYSSTISALRRVEDGARSSISPTTSVPFGAGMLAIDAITVAWKPSDLPLFPENGMPIVGDSDMEELGLESSLVRGVGYQTTESISRATAEPTSSRSVGGRLGVKDIVIWGLVGLACLMQEVIY